MVRARGVGVAIFYFFRERGGSDNFLCVGFGGGGVGHLKKSPESGCHMYMRLSHAYAIIAWLCDKKPAAHAGRSGQGGMGVPF
jgi:hypothetical protein